MKILLIHQFFVSPEEPGGSRHFELLRYWQKSGCDVRVVAGSVNYMTNKTKLPFGKFRRREIVAGIPVTWVYAVPSLHLRIVGRLLTYLSFWALALPVTLKESPNLVIATSPPPSVAVLGWMMRRLKKIPWIFEVRDLSPATAVELRFIQKGSIYRLLQRFIGFLYNKASFIVTLTPGIKNSLVTAGVPADKIMTIPNGVDDIFLRPPVARQPALQKLKEAGKFLIMYVGAIGPANHISTLVQLAEQMHDHPEIHFVFVGDGQERKNLQQIAWDKNLGNVTFLGTVKREEVPASLQYADLCVATWGKGSGFQCVLSNKLFDYMAAGKPVLLAAEKGDAWNLLQEAGGGIHSEPDDLNSMKNKILSLKENPAKGKQMGEAGKAYVLKNFMRKDLAQKYLNLIKTRIL